MPACILIVFRCYADVNAVRKQRAAFRAIGLLVLWTIRRVRYDSHKRLAPIIFFSFFFFYDCSIFARQRVMKIAASKIVMKENTTDFPL